MTHPTGMKHTPAPWVHYDDSNDGKTNRQIAGELVLSERTVATHLDHIFAKLGVSTRTAVAAHALRQGLA